ncbi:hypothetical protein EDB85DRAFT_2289859 [Lactarius pseudohatsudake]|nr:hypothetical protein EDB85DRAFT_2289859 [Lactarius pseudohatsudake]
MPVVSRPVTVWSHIQYRPTRARAQAPHYFSFKNQLSSFPFDPPLNAPQLAPTGTLVWLTISLLNLSWSIFSAPFAAPARVFGRTSPSRVITGYSSEGFEIVVSAPSVSIIDDGSSSTGGPRSTRPNARPRTPLYGLYVSPKLVDLQYAKKRGRYLRFGRGWVSPLADVPRGIAARPGADAGRVAPGITEVELPGDQHSVRLAHSPPPLVPLRVARDDVLD